MDEIESDLCTKLVFRAFWNSELQLRDCGLTVALIDFSYNNRVWVSDEIMDHFRLSMLLSLILTYLHAFSSAEAAEGNVFRAIRRANSLGQNVGP